MKEIIGDLWDYQGRAILALTTNGSLSRDRSLPISLTNVFC